MNGLKSSSPMGPPPQTGCIFVTGVWNSCNQLVYSALNEMGILGPFNGIAAHLVFGRHAWAKRLVRGPLGRADAVQVGLETDAYVSRRYIAASALRLSGRILGGHAAYSSELAEVLREVGARMVCIRRDPRDILVSFADWIGSRPDFYMHRDFAPLSREARITLLLRGGTGTGYTLNPFTEVLDRAAGWLDQPGMLRVPFEELIGTKGGGNSAAQNAIVRRMHAHLGAPKPFSQVRTENIFGGTLTFNKGRSQRNKEITNPDLRAEIDETLAPNLARWGYTL